MKQAWCIAWICAAVGCANGSDPDELETELSSTNLMAINVRYRNASSALAATDVQAAVDEVVERIASIPAGPQGPAGMQGPAGEQGPAGDEGPAGPAGTLTLPFSENASSTTSLFAVTNEGAGAGLSGQSESGYGVTGVTNGFFAGVFGSSPGIGAGVMGESHDGFGVFGVSHSFDAAGVKGSSLMATGVFGETGWGVAVLGKANGPGLAGWFIGNVQVTGDLAVSGNLSKGGGSFKIDHPLDPKNKILYHSFVESPDMMNIYNGNTVLDGEGAAVIELPAWFEALNRDFRYLLTPIGAPGPNLYVAEQVDNHRFKIAGGKPGMLVSWQITGIRHDAYADAHRIPVEQDKPQAQRGSYLYPEAFRRN